MMESPGGPEGCSPPTLGNRPSLGRPGRTWGSGQCEGSAPCATISRQAELRITDLPDFTSGRRPLRLVRYEALPRAGGDPDSQPDVLSSADGNISRSMTTGVFA